MFLEQIDPLGACVALSTNQLRAREVRCWPIRVKIIGRRGRGRTRRPAA